LKALFFEFFKNLLRIFSGYNLMAHALAIALTFLIVTSGLDWLYLKTAPEFLSREYFFPAIFMGSLFPLLVPLLLLVGGKIVKSFETVNLAFAMGQAAIFGSIISSLYKTFTGRIPPQVIRAAENILPTIDTSHGFQFGFLRGGVFWGWPSSHTTIAFAMTVAFAVLLARKSKWAYLSILYALYVGIAISFTIHWLSEFIAGAIIGAVIGLVVAKSFSKRLDQKIEIISTDHQRT